jgi:hypothetical protein
LKQPSSATALESNKIGMRLRDMMEAPKEKARREGGLAVVV